MAEYLQETNTQPQYGPEAIAQYHTVWGRECLGKALCCRNRFSQSILREPENLNITEQ